MLLKSDISVVIELYKNTSYPHLAGAKTQETQMEVLSQGAYAMTRSNDWK